MKKLYIVGAGGFGREIYGWAMDCPEWDTVWSFAGFLDDAKKPGEEIFKNATVVGGIKDYKPQPGELLINGIGTMHNKRLILPNLEAKNCQFANMIHPTAKIGRNVNLGKGAVICPFAVLTCDIFIGDFCSINLHATVGHDVEAGNLLQMNCHSEINGNCKLGDNVFIGGHAFIIQKIQIGNNTVVGAGSVVLRSIKENATVFGNPAKLTLPFN